MTYVVPAGASSKIILDERALREWGEQFGRAAKAPLVVALSGELGAGKTTLVQAICAGYEVRDTVTSPTFALVHQYDSPRGHVYHVDLHRLEGPAQLTNIGWHEIASADALVLVEWPERAADGMPDHVPIALEYGPEPHLRVLLAG